jgi:hypothetical protein
MRSHHHKLESKPYAGAEKKIMWIYLSLLVALIGLIMFALATNPKLVRIGEILLFTGTLAFLIRASEALFKIAP